MAYSQDKNGESPGEIRTFRMTRITSRSDLFPRLVSMQKIINARHFAVFRISGGGLPSKRKLVCELENWGPSNITASQMFVEAYGDALIDHMEKSLLPLMWNGRDEASIAETSQRLHHVYIQLHRPGKRRARRPARQELPYHDGPAVARRAAGGAG